MKARVKATQVIIECPGCRERHMVTTPRWTFSGTEERPTIRPSILVTSGHYTPRFKKGDACWCTFYRDHPQEDPGSLRFRCERCHSFVTDGNIKFLDDSTHALSGKTVELPDLDDDQV